MEPVETRERTVEAWEEVIAPRLAQVRERSGEQVPASGAAQGTLEVGKAMAAAR